MNKKKKLIYHLTNRGTYSELNNLLIFAFLAERLDMDFFIDDRCWSGKFKKGFADYFDTKNVAIHTVGPKIESFSLNAATGKSLFKNRLVMIFYYIKKFFIKKYLKYFFPENEYAMNLWLKSRLIRYAPYIDQREKTCWPLESFIKLNSTLLKYNADVEKYINLQYEKVTGYLGNDFLACHLRRGDKVGREMGFIPLRVYAEEIVKSGYQKIFICTDSYKDFCDLCKILPKEFLCFSFADSTSTGFSENKFRKSLGDKKYQEMISLFSDVEIMIRSKYFIGTYSSCMGQYIGLRRNLKDSKSLDNHWCFE